MGHPKRKFNIGDEVVTLVDIKTVTVSYGSSSKGKVKTDTIPKGAVGEIKEFRIGSISCDYVYSVEIKLRTPDPHRKIFYTSDLYINFAVPQRGKHE